jgi:hypothetical protein
MPLPGSKREKELLREVAHEEPVTGNAPAVFLQEIKEPVHEETIVEQPTKKRRRSKKSA